MMRYDDDERLIFTIDIDSFFASAETARRPEYKGKPLVVGDELNNRGIIAAANYEARAYGVHAGMPLFKARALCSELVVIPTDHEYYQQIANDFFKVVLSFTPKVQVASIDECYADVTHLMFKYEPLELANIMRAKIYEETGLSNSIGISTNILLSKMASNIDKPFGIATLYKHEIPNKLWNLPIGKMFMVGEKTANKFIDEGIKTIKDLAMIKNDFEKYSKLKQKFGINLDKHIDAANGKSTDKVVLEEPTIKSISKDRTFPFSIRELEILLIKVRELFDIVTKRANNRKLWPSTVTVAFKVDKSFKRISNSKKLSKATTDTNYTWPVVEDMVEKLFKSGMSIKFASVSFDGLKESEKVYTQTYIGQEDIKPKSKLQQLAEEISFKGNSEVVVASTMEDNFRYKKNKDPLMSDNIKFKVWDK